MSDESETYVIFSKKKTGVSEDEVDRLMVVAQNNLAEVVQKPSGTIIMTFPDNFQAREFRDKLLNYYPNWSMRRRKK